ncbi:transcription factor bHLH19 isoform X2 [Medicago truncatula]|uniref:transcription factor bHLH19 isoform X2 n=1 Tax=Medicago truncatula TaxID=3880 RepID=UPI000D2F2C7E|nr:transcription factor bHLH19 isoform X2 [Medicago truncatula]
MEESGENWPSNSDLEISDEAILKDGESESVCDDDYCEDQIGDPTDNTKENNEKEITEMLKELSDVMGLKKMDELSIIEQARDYLATLQERVRELEEEAGSNICTNKRTKLSSNITLPEVKAKVLQKDVLVIVHCEKQNDG